MNLFNLLIKAKLTKKTTKKTFFFQIGNGFIHLPAENKRGKICTDCNLVTDMNW